MKLLVPIFCIGVLLIGCTSDAGASGAAPQGIAESSPAALPPPEECERATAGQPVLLKDELEEFTLGIRFCSNRYNWLPLGREEMTLGRLRPTQRIGVVKVDASLVGSGGCTYRVSLQDASARVLGGDGCYNE
ncbi:MAG: hypothetical protein GEU71_13685 [Actinobacteria bacterium]|nr:hypothetical protein [Actinomycetota bacterium]